MGGEDGRKEKKEHLFPIRFPLADHVMMLLFAAPARIPGGSTLSPISAPRATVKSEILIPCPSEQGLVVPSHLPSTASRASLRLL